MAHSSGNLALSLVEAVEVKRRDDENRNSRGNEMLGCITPCPQSICELRYHAPPARLRNS